MSSNYRIIDFGTHMALHEVHYADDGTPTEYTAEPARFVTNADEGFVGIVASLHRAQSDAEQRPILLLTELPRPA